MFVHHLSGFGSAAARATALAAAAALALTGCPMGVGAACDEASDCRDELYCDPITNTCQKSGTKSDASTTDAAPGTDAASTDAAPGADAAGTDGATGTDSAPPGTDAAPSSVTFCTSAGGCAVGETCHLAYCDMTGVAEGFCTEAGRPSCSLFLGEPCPPGIYSFCHNEGSCVDDASGICVTPEEHMAICAMQPSLWSCP